MFWFLGCFARWRGQTSGRFAITPNFGRSKKYGYPAYDYDFWQVDEESEYYDPDNEWRAGWYYGYWSYWTGVVTNPNLTYSGVGYSGHKIANGGIEGWSYSDIAEINEGVPPGDDEIEYVEEPGQNTVILPSVNGLIANSVVVYNLNGLVVATEEKGYAALGKGMYIVNRNGKISKVFIK